MLWLSPVYRSPMDDNGYDISDYQDVDPTFGTLEELEELIEAVHERGMKLVMDLVVNHTSDEHPWFVESRDPASPKRDWYWWRPARAGREPGTEGAEPTNWGSAFSGSAWQYDERSGEYFLHMFSPKQPDLNWENPDVRQAVYAMMRWWVDRGVDGFRMDVINLISKPAELTDGDPPPGQRYHSAFASIANGHRLDEFLAEMNAEVGLDRLNSARRWARCRAPRCRRRDRPPIRSGTSSTWCSPSSTSAWTASPGGTKWDLAELPLPVLKANLAAWQEGLADVGWNSLYWDNHDQPRAVSRFGDDRPEHRVASAKTLATVLHLHRGTPYVYQGEELGMTNTYFSDISQYRDLESLNYHADALSLGLEAETVLRSLGAKSRDNARTPMHWDDTTHAGFSSGIPWLPVNPNYVTINAAAAVADPGSVFHHFRALIKLRHDEPIVVEGAFDLLLPDDQQIWAFTRTLEGQSLLVWPTSPPSRRSVPDAGLPDLSDAAVLLGHATAVPTPGGSSPGSRASTVWPERVGEAMAGNRWLVLVSMTGSLAMIMLDQTVVSVALPAMTADLSLSADERPVGHQRVRAGHGGAGGAGRTAG